MTITYPLSLPAVPAFRDVTMRRMPVVGLSRSPYTGAQQTIVFSGQWWEMDLGLPTLKDEHTALWEAFLGKLNGQEGTFLAGDPARKIPRGVCAGTPGTPLVDGPVAARAQSLPIKGGPASVTGWIAEGDYIQIGTGSSSRYHQALSTVHTDTNGETSVDVWPRIRTALTGDEVITFSNAKGVFRLASNSVDVSKRIGRFSDIRFSAIEAF